METTTAAETDAIALEIQRLAARIRLEAQERGEASSLSIALMAAAAHEMIFVCAKHQQRRHSGGGGGGGGGKERPGENVTK